MRKIKINKENRTSIVMASLIALFLLYLTSPLSALAEPSLTFWPTVLLPIVSIGFIVSVVAVSHLLYMVGLQRGGKSLMSSLTTIMGLAFIATFFIIALTTGLTFELTADTQRALVFFSAVPPMSLCMFILMVLVD